MTFELEWRAQEFGGLTDQHCDNPIFHISQHFLSVYTLNRYCVDCRK